MISIMATNATFPPLPSYTIATLPPLIPGLPDKYLSPLLLIAAYWAVSGLWHMVDTLDLFPQYRLHTPEEVLKRNHVSRRDVLTSVLLQQAMQAVFGLFLGFIEEDATTGKQSYDIAVWAQRIRWAEQAVPGALALVGLDALELSKNKFIQHSALSGLLAGGQYSSYQATASGIAPAFVGWELMAAKLVYYLLVPVVQFTVAIVILDTWQYFWHRAMHMNKWMFTKFHSHHHRLYVPYAYGALYNHPAEGFVLDTLGAGLAYLVTGMTCRQGMCFFTCSTIKTIDDHCGYALPFDPLQHLTANNAGYHDIHHQSWGIKTNFSQPFFTFWDRFLDTKFTGDTSLRYERDRKAMDRRTAAQQKIIEEQQTEPVVPIKVEPVIESIEAALPDSIPMFSHREEPEPVTEERVLRRSPRKRTRASSQTTSGSLAAPFKELRNRMNTSLHGRASGVLGVDSH